MLQAHSPELLDDAGDFYSALGWAAARGKGKPEAEYSREEKIFSACAGAAIYRRKVLLGLGLFDEEHFAYLEDLDICYRARLHGYENWYLPKARVRHVGSGTSGSRYNLFKVRYSSRNNIYLIWKNMPLFQILLNLPFLLAGFGAKFLFFAGKGFGKEYLAGIRNGFQPVSYTHLTSCCALTIISAISLRFAQIWQDGPEDSEGSMRGRRITITFFGVRSSLPGSVMCLSLIHIFQEEIKNPILAFSLKDLKGTELTGTNTVIEKIDTGTVSSGEIVEISFSQVMRLQGGQYLLQLGCTGFENGDNFVVYHRLYDVCCIQVIGDKTTVGYFDMDSKVQYTKGN